MCVQTTVLVIALRNSSNFIMYFYSKHELLVSRLSYITGNGSLGYPKEGTSVAARWSMIYR